MLYSKCQNASDNTITGVNPPKDQSLLVHAIDNSTLPRSDWNWSGYRDAHRLRRWKWDDYRVAASQERPLYLQYRECQSRIDYIQADDIRGFLQNSGQDSRSSIRLILSFTKEICAPYTPSLCSTTLLRLSSLFGVERLQHHYPSQMTTSFSREVSPDKESQGRQPPARPTLSFGSSC